MYIHICIRKKKYKHKQRNNKQMADIIYKHNYNIVSGNMLFQFKTLTMRINIFRT